MGEDVKIVPTILTADPQLFATQLEAYQKFSRRVQLDIMDGTFTADKSISDAAIAQLPPNLAVDIHLMSARPSDHLPHILRLKPSLCILHAEANENLLPFFNEFKKVGIKCGVALLPGTYPELVKPYIDVADHVLIFAGSLGKQGGEADLLQIEKIKIVRKLKSDLEIGWDGGANLTNIRALAHADINVINVGSAISKAENPADAYSNLVEESKKRGVL